MIRRTSLEPSAVEPAQEHDASGPRAGRRCQPGHYRPSARLVAGECATIGIGDTRSHNNAEGIGE